MTIKLSLDKVENNVLNDLLATQSIELDSIELFSKHTRDKKDLEVKIDKNSGVIFIPDYYIGHENYVDGLYKNITHLKFHEFENFEDQEDSERRVTQFKNFIFKKNICDFGCGKGSFLRLANECASKVYGVEIQKNYLNLLKKNNINCVDDIQKFTTKFDTIFMFHTLEHLPNQIEVLNQIKNFIKPGGKLVVEVPHANDYLLSNLKIEEFKEFTLWSQHLILHTKKSLENFLKHAGYKDIEILGFQRYSIANHFGWLKNKTPGGHKSDLINIETEELVEAYKNALNKIGASDTLIAHASVQ